MTRRRSVPNRDVTSSIQQFEQLQPVEQQLLEAAAVTGHEWDTRTVASALGADPTEIAHCAETLGARRLFIRARTDDSLALRAPRFAFQHAIIRDAWTSG